MEPWRIHHCDRLLSFEKANHYSNFFKVARINFNVKFLSLSAFEIILSGNSFVNASLSSLTFQGNYFAIFPTAEIIKMAKGRCLCVQFDSAFLSVFSFL